MMEGMENKYSENESETVSLSDQRFALLKESAKKLEKVLSPEALDILEAIILRGSTASGFATEKSDIDYSIVPKAGSKFSSETLNLINRVLFESLPDIASQFTCLPILPSSRAANLFVKRSSKHRERKPAWKFIYVKDEDTKQRLDTILHEAQNQMEQFYAMQREAWESTKNR